LTTTGDAVADSFAQDLTDEGSFEGKAQSLIIWDTDKSSQMNGIEASLMNSWYLK